MLTEAEIKEARAFLQNAENPFFLYDDDCDGLCSYLILKKYCNGKGSGMSLKAGAGANNQDVDLLMVDKIQRVNPDVLVILDRPLISQDFLDKLAVPVLWFDHHQLVQRRKVHYYNPRKHDPKDNRPTTYLAWSVAQQSLWIATVGSIADWYMPDFLDEFKRQYPDIITKGEEPGAIMFTTPMGRLIKTLYFVLKGKTDDIKRNIAALEKVQHPDEILQETSEEGKFLVRRTKALMKEYEEMLENAKKQVTEDRLFIFIYPSTRNSFVSILANELSFLYPEKVLVIGREKGNEIRISVRNKDLHLPSILEKSLVGVRGHGGGHDHACGGSIVSSDFERFIENMKREIGEAG